MSIVFSRRYTGPPDSANGGWTAGVLAEQVLTTAGGPAVTVRLHSPPPLETELSLRQTPEGTELRDDAHLVAAGAPVPAPTGDVPAPVGAEQALAAAAAYEGLVDHPFPMCFVCGTEREPGDGLLLRPGPLDDGTGRYAAHWVPFASSVPMVWAALDCPGGWSAGIAGRPMVLGTMTTLVEEPPEVGEPHVVLAWTRGGKGRKHLSGSALFTAGGRLLARAEAIWIAVDPASIRPLGASR